jgi:hypothetical protein
MSKLHPKVGFMDIMHFEKEKQHVFTNKIDAERLKKCKKVLFHHKL